MNILKTFYTNLLLISICLVISGCVKDRDFDKPEILCSEDDFTTIKISELKNLYEGQTIQIQDDLMLDGYVISSDREGNFFNVIHFQDKPSNPTEGLQVELELRDSHLFFNVGQHIFIKLKGLYLGKSGEVYKIGGVFTSFGNRTVGRLPNNIISEHILLSCEANNGIEPTLVTLSELDDSYINTLVRINNIEFSDENIGMPYAIKEEETKSTLIDCDDNELVLLNSGYSNFQSQPIPAESGAITGILTKDKNEFQLIIRSLSDVDFTMERCVDLVDEFTSSTILISEIADPDNNADARFIELYNSSDEPLSLKGWSLVRYTNANITVSSSIDLSDYTIDGKGLLVISPNASAFENVYGFSPDISVGTNSPADSNGDDNIALLDPFGAIIDVFGVIGEDGSGTNHEFEDGRALRLLEVINGNSMFTDSEWVIYNDTGNDGTINQPQNAPSDFTPGIR